MNLPAVSGVRSRQKRISSISVLCGCTLQSLKDNWTLKSTGQ